MNIVVPSNRGKLLIIKTAGSVSPAPDSDMLKINVPQDGGIAEGLKEVTYAVGPEGTYELVPSSGWEPKNISNHQAWEVIADEVERVRLKVKDGTLSPLAYHMTRNLMDISLLASYMDMFQWRVKRHFKPAVFRKLKPELLAKYAALFKISIDQLKDISLLEKMKIPGQEKR